MSIAASWTHRVDMMELWLKSRSEGSHLVRWIELGPKEVEEGVDLLQDYSTNTEARNSYGRLPIDLSESKGHAEMSQLLREAQWQGFETERSPKKKERYEVC